METVGNFFTKSANWARGVGWEWRCFVPSDTTLTIPEASGAEVKTRKDQYLLVGSDRIGIKVRGGGGLEVKECQEKKQRLAYN